MEASWIRIHTHDYMHGFQIRSCSRHCDIARGRRRRRYSDFLRLGFLLLARGPISRGIRVPIPGNRIRGPRTTAIMMDPKVESKRRPTPKIESKPGTWMKLHKATPAKITTILDVEAHSDLNERVFFGSSRVPSESKMVEKIILSVADYLILTFLLVASAMIGVVFAWRGRRKNNQNFLTGNRKLGVFPIAMSLIASYMSSNSMLGVPAEMYRRGVVFYVSWLTSVLAVVCAAEIFLPIYYRLNLTSVHKYLKLRFDSSTVRIAGSIGFILCTLPYMGVVLYGPSLALGSVTPLSVDHSILVVGLICTFYTSAGGIKAVIWTDVLQVLLMVAGFMMVIVQGCIEVGGISEIFRRANEGKRLQINTEFDLYSPVSVWNVFLGTFITWTGTYSVKQTQVQRYCSMPSVKRAKLALYLNLFGLSILIAMSCLSGVVLYGYFHNCDPLQQNVITQVDQLMPYFVMKTLGHIPGIPGLFIAAVFSGSLSTLSSGFNALTAITWDDFLKHCCTRKEKKALWITRTIAVFYGVLSVGIAYLVGRLGSVLEASLSVAGAIAGPLLGIFVLGIFFPFTNGKGALSGIMTGMGVSVWITVGTLLYRRPVVELTTSISECPNLNGTEIITQAGEWIVRPENYEKTGLLYMYHLSYVLISVLGFLITVVVGVVISLATGGKKDVDPKLVCPVTKYLCYPCIPASWKESDDVSKEKPSNVTDDASFHNLFINPVADYENAPTLPLKTKLESTAEPMGSFSKPVMRNGELNNEDTGV